MSNVVPFPVPSSPKRRPVAVPQANIARAAESRPIPRARLVRGR